MLNAPVRGETAERSDWSGTAVALTLWPARMIRDFHAPVFWREMRMASRRGCWRWSWKWLLGSVLGALLVTLVLPQQARGNPFYLVQWLGYAGGAIVSLMPVGFAADRAAGQQSLLGLTGLGPLRVFAESAAASLWTALELGMITVPIAVAMMAFHHGRAMAIPFVASLPMAMVFWIATCWIVGVAVGTTRSTAVQVSLLAGAFMVVTAALELWLKGRISALLEGLLFVTGGGSDWAQLGEAYQPNGTVLPLVRVLTRLTAWGILNLVVAAWWFQVEWRRMESCGDSLPSWMAWFQAATRGQRRPPSDENAYLVRFSRPTAWRKLRWVLGAFALGLGVTLAVSWTWLALPLVLLLWITGVDVLAHIAVSGAPAEDRRSGALELLFTSPLNPTTLLEAGTVAGRELVRAGMAPAIVMALVFAGVGVLTVDPTEYPLTTDRCSIGAMLLWPLIYSGFLIRLPFRVPVSQAVNTGEPFHSFAFPVSPILLSAALGGLVWAMLDGSEEVRYISNAGGVVFLLIVLLLRRHFAHSEGLDDEGLRTVAAAPLPVEGAIPKDGRTIRPWVPEGFQR